MQYRKDIDGLRAIAVLSVVFFHANGSWIKGGFVGVDIFFVISGFLICRIIVQELEKGRFSLLGFYDRRARRILPALSVVIIFSALAGLFLYLPQDLDALGDAIVASALFVSNFYFMTEVHYFAAPLESYSLLHLWSLAVEEQFYIITPVIMIMVYRFKPDWMLNTLILLSVLSFVVSVVLVGIYPKGAFYMLPSRFWELGLGAILGVAPIPFPRRRSAHIASLAGGALILGSVFLIHDGPPFPGLLAVPPVVGAALIIWAGPEGIFNKLLGLRPVVWVGLISYSLYLWHWPILSYAKYVTVSDLTPGQTLLALSASLIAAILSYRFVERPFRRRSERKIGHVLSVAVGVLVSLTVTGALLSVGQGYPGRWQSTALEVLRPSDKVSGSYRSGCNNVQIESLPFGKTCVVGTGAEPYDFIVWGDSHARAMRVGFAKMAQDTETSGLIIYKPACASLLGKRNRNMPFWLHCTDHNQAVLTFLETQQTDMIILVSLWTAKENIQFYNGETAPVLARILPLSDTGSFKASVERTVRIIQAQGKKVAWLKTVPGQHWDVPRTLAKSLEWQRPLPPLRSRQDYKARNADVDRVFSGIEGIITIPSADVLCDDTQCYAERDGTALYFDEGHISPYGATLLSKTISQTINGASSP